MTVTELKHLIGKEVTDIEYESESNSAYIIYGSGYGIEVEVEPIMEDD